MNEAPENFIFSDKLFNKKVSKEIVNILSENGIIIEHLPAVRIQDDGEIEQLSFTSFINGKDFHNYIELADELARNLILDISYCCNRLKKIIYMVPTFDIEPASPHVKPWMTTSQFTINYYGKII